jgi:hypothetical protein
MIGYSERIMVQWMGAALSRIMRGHPAKAGFRKWLKQWLKQSPPHFKGGERRPKVLFVGGRLPMITRDSLPYRY